MHRGSESAIILLRQRVKRRRGDPRCRHSVAATCSVMKWSKGARWWRHSTAGTSPRTPAGCCSARPIGRSVWSGGSPPVSADGRAQAQVEHTIETMVAQRVFGIALGYEDLIDHDQLRHDPVLATARRQARGQAQGLRAAGRQEHVEPARACALRSRAVTTRSGMTRRRSSACSSTFSSRRTRRRPSRIVLDLDATDDPLHGHQEGRFFHGYYDCYCYLPLYVFCGRHLLAAKLRRSNIDASAGAMDEVARIVGQIRARWPRVSDPAARRFRLCPRRADDVVRGERRRLRLRPRAQRAPGRRHRRRARSRRSREPGPAAARRAASPTSPGARWTAGAARAGSSPRPSTCPRARIRALS